MSRGVASASLWQGWLGVAQARVTAAYFNAETLERAASARALAAAADTLRCLWVAEPLEKGMERVVFEQLPDAALTLGYGLLEATPFVVATVLRAGDGELIGDPIGRPLMNMRARTPPLPAHHASLLLPHWVLCITTCAREVESTKH